ncbi:pseudoazurin [Comamonas antarctica]|uniref:Pseudoazurin n=1 Tax=Comamonas antarctica TaxID=2743470 RepID=A0A6N1XBQ7_9BURK|nr:pseudoazurin [Comamonas antarctica]QKV55180.1 pseudoazurin [Comamonas antarctica]
MNHKMLAGLCLALTVAPLAWAENFEVRMLNRGSQGAMVYEPEFIQLEPGDRIKFLASSSGHDAVSIDGMLPAGAQPFKGRINEEIEVAFTEPGLYGIKCLPHYAMGMVMLVQVGAAPLSTLKIPADAPERAQKRFQDIAARAAR